MNFYWYCWKYSELVASRKAEDIEYQKDLDHLLRHSRYTTQDSKLQLIFLKETDNWLTPAEMSYHGLCDEITEPRPRKKKRNAKKKTTRRKTK